MSFDKRSPIPKHIRYCPSQPQSDSTWRECNKERCGEWDVKNEQCGRLTQTLALEKVAVTLRAFLELSKKKGIL